MGFEELFKYLPKLFSLFIPGFIFLSVTDYFLKNKSKHFEITIIGSVVISYIIQLFCQLINSFFKLSALLLSITAVFFGLVAALLFVKFKISSTTKKASVFLGKVTGDKDIWHTIFDLNKGARIRFCTVFNHENVIVEGDIKYFDVCSDGQCDIVIFNYRINYKEKTHSLYNNMLSQNFLYVNTRDIHGLEISNGEKTNTK